MPFGEVIIPYEWVVNQRLQYDTHEAGLPHVVQPSEANCSTG
jgi:hypothetical protein